MSAALLLDEPAAAACRHCGQNSAGAEFCCAGCAGAFALIHELGLDAYYGRRDGAGSAPGTAPGTGAEDAPALGLADRVETGPDGLHCLRLRVDGLACGACVWLIESALARRPGVVDARVNLTARRLTLRWRGPAEAAEALAGVVRRLGYRLAPLDAAAADPAQAAEKELLQCMAVAGFAAMNIMLLSVSVWSGHAQGMGEATRGFMHWLSALIALPTVAFCARPFFRSAIGALRAGRTNMDVPISLGVTLASGISVWETAQGGRHAYFDGAVMLLFFLLIGRYLDGRARGRARSAAEHLLALSRTPVTVLDPGGGARVTAPQAVRPGDLVLVAAGERVGVDGAVVEGRSSLDASVVTGETHPQPVSPGETAYAGTVNLDAPLRLRATASGQGTLLAEMVRLMDAAEQGRGRFVALADRVARRYTPVVHTLALGTFLAWVLGAGMAWQPALLIAVAVLIITCPCALALAVPTVQVVASGRLMRGGVLLKSATALERLARVDTVVFDKTGTLTVGRPELVVEPGLDADALAFAASVARNSRHPLSRALARAGGPGMPASGVREIPGRGLILDAPEGEVRLGSRAFCGVLGEGDGTVLELWLARPGRAPSRFTFADAPRADATEVVRALAARGLRVELLSGDRPSVVGALANRLGIEAWRGGVDPAGKCAHLERLRAEGRRVLMVGDGLNDAPALAAAEVSASPATAADIAQTSADAVFQGDRLTPVLELLVTARGADRLVRQNLGFSLLYNLFAVPLAMLGHVTPLIAAVAMSSSSLVVMLNALRLSKGRP